jgi:hypothetical protein
MTRPLDDDLRELLARGASVDDGEVDALRRYAAILPARRSPGMRRRMLAAAAGIVLLVSFGGLTLVANLPLGTSGAAPDARLAVCGVTADDAVAIFSMDHLRDYRLHLPAARPLEGSAATSDAPALVIVLRGSAPITSSGATASPSGHDLCIVAGTGETPWERIDAPGVDTTGMVEVLPEPFSTPIAADLAPWVARCGAGIEGVDILEIVRVDHGTGIAARLILDPEPPELATDAPAAVIVYHSTHPFPPLGTPPAEGATIGPREPVAEGHYDLCVLVGSDAATAERTIHEDVAVEIIIPAEATPDASPSPSTISTRPAQIDPAECARMTFAEDRCLAVVESAMEQAGLTWPEIEGVSLAKLPNAGYLGGGPVAGVTFVLRDGSRREQDVICGGISIYNLVCTDRPEVMLIAPYGAGSGYHDVPCGAVPGGEAGSACATPMSGIDPDAARAGVPLEAASHDYAIAGLGPQEILVGSATLPNGILSDARFSLADPFTRAFAVRDGIALVVRPLDPARPLFVNIYAHGWYTGTEEVEVYLVFDVTAFTPGATLEVRDLVVR